MTVSPTRSRAPVASIHNTEIGASVACDLILPDNSSCDQTVTRSLGTNKWSQRQRGGPGIRHDLKCRYGLDSSVSKIDDQVTANPWTPVRKGPVSNSRKTPRDTAKVSHSRLRIVGHLKNVGKFMTVFCMKESVLTVKMFHARRS